MLYEVTVPCFMQKMHTVHESVNSERLFGHHLKYLPFVHKNIILPDIWRVFLNSLKDDKFDEIQTRAAQNLFVYSTEVSFKEIKETTLRTTLRTASSPDFPKHDWKAATSDGDVSYRNTQLSYDV